MAQDFRSVISELWAKLKLGPPEFGPTYTVDLAVDGFDVTLSESADGRHIVVTGVIGRLAPDAHRRDEQVRRLLKANLGMLQTNKAGLSIDAADGPATAQVVASYPYAANRIDLLTLLIEHVLFRLEFHTAELANSGQRPTAPDPALASASQETFIFRP